VLAHRIIADGTDPRSAVFDAVQLALPAAA
jgi:hypothetical protein